ncbi:hypothetical protein MR857_12965 [bacterium]|nr:hypothetical protein [bacterium]MDY3023403.1 hypothetical protein [Oliverpabstia sp.]
MQGIYIQDLGLSFVKTCFSTYWEGLCFFGLYLFAIFFLMSSPKKEHKMLSIYTLFLFATIFNPILIKYFFVQFNMDDVYYRFIWLLPVNILLAYFFIHCIDRGNSSAQKLLIILCMVCAIIFTGNPVKYWKSAIAFPDNLYKVTDDVLEISEYIHQDAEEKNPLIAVSSDLIMTIRQYDASLILTLDRDMVICWQGSPNFQDLVYHEQYSTQKAIMDVIYGGDTSHPEEFQAAIQSTSTQYLVYSNQLDITEFLKNEGFTSIAQTENYIICRNVNFLKN